MCVYVYVSVDYMTSIGINNNSWAPFYLIELVPFRNKQNTHYNLRNRNEYNVLFRTPEYVTQWSKQNHQLGYLSRRTTFVLVPGQYLPSIRAYETNVPVVVCTPICLKTIYYLPLFVVIGSKKKKLINSSSLVNSIYITVDDTCTMSGGRHLPRNPSSYRIIIGYLKLWTVSSISILKVGRTFKYNTLSIINLYYFVDIFQGIWQVGSNMVLNGTRVENVGEKLNLYLYAN